MDLLPLAMIQAEKSTNRLMHSALPGAPVVPPARHRPSTFRIRAAAARMLERLAQTVAPEPAGSCSPAH
jgi:hypothetical protein